MINGLTGAWAVSTFGFISVAFAPIPWMLYIFGAKLRAQSKYNLQTLAQHKDAMVNHDEEMQIQVGHR